MLDLIKWAKPLMWLNPEYFNLPDDMMLKHDLLNDLSREKISEAGERLKKFSPYLAATFPDLKKTDGVIQSRLIETSDLKQELSRKTGVETEGKFFLKCDNELPVSGSIKARGGFNEVLKTAEQIMIKNKKLKEGDDYLIFSSREFSDFLSEYQLTVGSTGNLGLSTGIIGARLGFSVTVHVPENAKHWKKVILQKNGVRVKEYKNDYSHAVEMGRKEAELNEKCHFIDDEKSEDLFFGCSTAAKELADQFADAGISVDSEHPLFVYIPCDAGGASSGVAYGLKKIFGTNVHCFFSEPVQSPSMILGLITGRYNRICVHDMGLNNRTIADILAVERTSGFASKSIEPYLGGIFTVTDKELHLGQALLYVTENIYVEPSAAAGIKGPVNLFGTEQGRQFIERHGLKNTIAHGSHVIWATDGSLVPANIRVNELEKSTSVLMTY